MQESSKPLNYFNKKRSSFDFLNGNDVYENVNLCTNGLHEKDSFPLYYHYIDLSEGKV